eukprot:UC4_evm7s1059
MAATGTTILLLTACIFALLFGTPAQHIKNNDWNWSRTRTWMEFNIRNAAMTEYQAKFAATHYDIIGIGGTFDGGPYSGEKTQAAAAKKLKSYNSAVRTLIYRNSDVVIVGELNSDREFQSHPEWIVTNSSGAPVYNNPSTKMQPFINFTNPSAREWWVRSIVAAITPDIDGVYVDGAGDFEVLSQGLAPGQNALLNASHALAMQELTAQLHALRSDMITIGNGAVLPICGRTDDGSKYGKMDFNPCARNLPYLDGVCAEHFGSFESVNSSSGNYDTNGGPSQNYRGGNTNEKWQNSIDIVKRFDNSTKSILIKSWPGPINLYMIDNVADFTWKNLSDANIRLNNTLRKVLGARAFPWAHAAYLLSAGPQTYMSYGWWWV